MADPSTEIGTVVSVDSGRRRIRIRPRPGRGFRFDDIEWLRVILPGGREVRCKVLAAAREGDVVRVTFAPGIPRDTVSLMKGATIAGPEDDSEAPGPKGIVVDDLLGATVLDEAGNIVGEVAEAFTTPAHGLMSIRTPDGRSLLVPAIPEVIEHIDWEKGTIVVRDLGPYAVENEG